MSEFLVIRLPEAADDPVQWIAVDSTGARRGPPASGTLADAAAEIDDRLVIALVPSADVLTTSVDIPVKGAKLLAALPYALEEYLAEDVDDLHFAAGAKRSSGRTPVSVVSEKLLRSWLDRLRDADIKPVSVVAESYGLARIPGTISMLLAEQSVFINDGTDIELVLQGVSPGDALVAIGALDDAAGGDPAVGSGSPLPRHVLIYCDAEADQTYRHDWIAIRQELDSLEVKILPDGVTPRLAVTVATGAGINLLQGRFAPKKQYAGLFRPWRYAAALALAFVLVAIGAKAVSYFTLTARESELRQTFNAEYQSMLPGAPATEDPLAVVESLKRRLGTSESTPVFLESMAELAQAIRQNNQARIQAISFRAGVVDLRITAPDVATLDGVQRAIASSGRFQAAIQSTDQGSDGVSSRIQIEEAGS